MEKSFIITRYMVPLQHGNKYTPMPQNTIAVSRQLRSILSGQSELHVDTANISDHVKVVQEYKRHERRCYFRVAYMRLLPHLPEGGACTEPDSKKESELRFINNKLSEA